MMRASLAIALVLPVVLTGCPALLNEWTIADSDAVDASVAEVGGSAGYGHGGSSGSGTEGGASGSSGSLGSGGSSTGGSLSGGSGGAGGSSSGGSSSGGSPSSGGSSATDGGVACATDAVRCSGSQPQTCVDGIWLSNGPVCSGALPVCLAGACVACSPSSTSCADATQPMTCDAAGSWVLEAACAGTTPRCADGVCSACANTAVCPACPNQYTACCNTDGSCDCASAALEAACGGEPCNGAGLSTHHTGLGQTWQDCVPVGTYDAAQARKACDAWCAANGCACASQSSLCVTAAGGVSSAMVYGQTATATMGWTYPCPACTQTQYFGKVVDFDGGTCTTIGSWD